MAKNALTKRTYMANQGLDITKTCEKKYFGTKLVGQENVMLYACLVLGSTYTWFYKITKII